jgi:predicted ATPase
MRLPSFEIVNQRSIKLAQCVKVPPLMVVAGPNGSGKSTLLNAIRSQAGYTNIMYVGPHRAMRRQQVQSRHLLAPWCEDINRVQTRENPAKYPAKLAGYDVTYDFVYVDEESFEKYKPTSFRQLQEAFKEYKGEI